MRHPILICALLSALLAAPGLAGATHVATAGPGATDAQPIPGEAVSGTVVRVEAKIVPGAATSATLGTRRSGSGVILDARTVLTIGYLVLEADEVDVTTAAGVTVPGAVAGYDHASGFGLIRTALPMIGKAAEIGDSDLVAESQPVFTLGHGEAEATALRVLSRQPFAGGWEYLLERPILTIPPVNNWSGSALFTPDGKLVGVGSLIMADALPGGGRVPGNLFVPINLLKPIIADLRAHGRSKHPPQPWLGVTTEVFRGHVVVIRVSRDGPADNAGISAGDIIIGVGEEAIFGQADLYRRIWQRGPAGTVIPLRLLRGGEVREVSVASIDRMDFLKRPGGV